MKKLFKILSLVMIMTMIISSLAGCKLIRSMDDIDASNQRKEEIKKAEAQMAETVMFINDDIEVSGGYYGWYFSNEYNNQYSQAMAILEADSSADSSATPEVDTDLVKASTSQKIAEVKLAHKKAIEAGIQLTNEDKNIIKQQIASLKSQISQQGISVEDYLFILNTNETYLEEIIEEEYLGNLYFASLMSSSYATTKHIVVNFSDGSMTKEEAIKAANEIKAELDGGADFEKVMNEKSQDVRDADGNLIYKDANTFSLLSDQATSYIETALALKEGETSNVVVDTENEICFIIKKYPLNLTAIVTNLMSLTSDSVEGLLVQAEKGTLTENVKYKETDKINYYTDLFNAN